MPAPELRPRSELNSWPGPVSVAGLLEAMVMYRRYRAQRQPSGSCCLSHSRAGSLGPGVTAGRSGSAWRRQILIPEKYSFPHGAA